MKFYEKPIAEVVDFTAEQVMSDSGDITDGPSVSGGSGLIPGL